MREHRHTNGLINEKSPYLLQHANNPVNWRPWGAEAFATAKAENKPIFLSIGYSACHWCHVMKREVFEDERLAELMNKYFVCVKVDREERPDIDAIYMTVLGAMTGGGGWPMSMFLTPELKAFHGATYLPPQQFEVLIQRIHELWLENPAPLLGAGDKLFNVVGNALSPQPGTAPEASTLSRCVRRFQDMFDQASAGFGRSTKFPQPTILSFLLGRHARGDVPACLRMTEQTIRAMADGGIHDQIGGGFHRYSVDSQWRVPHFEKMLYDQAQIAAVCIEAYQATGDTFFAAAARRTLDYVLDRMSDKSGGFYSSEDAESAASPDAPDIREEGIFYCWTWGQVQEALPPQDADLFAYVYDAQPRGNVAEGLQQSLRGRNILRKAHSVDEAASHFGLPVDAVSESLASSSRKLLAIRQKRPHPRIDDKVLTSWNGLMISALSKAYQTLDDQKYLKAASRCADFIFGNLYKSEEGRLMRRHRDGDARIDATLSDYSFLVAGLLDLYEASFDVRRVQQALELTKLQCSLLYDSKSGGFFETSESDKTVPMRIKRAEDNVEPSGNSIAVLNLQRLAEITGDQSWRGMADETIDCFGGKISKMPEEFTTMLKAVELRLNPQPRVVIAGIPGADDTKALLGEVNSRLIPGRTLLLADGGEGQNFLASLLPGFEQMRPVNNKAAAYVCAHGVCLPPTTDPSDLAKTLNSLQKEMK